MTLLNPPPKRARPSKRSTGSDEVGDGKPHPGRRMTEQEFVEWVDDKTRAEWVDGEVILMPPVSDDHDDFAFWLRSVVQAFVQRHKLGRVKGPEFMVRLGRHRRRRIPDMLFVSKEREEIITGNHVEGAPDLIMELVSPESVSRDWRDKYLDYERAGVREYWVIDRATRQVEVYSLNANRKYERIGEKEGRIFSIVLTGFYLRPSWLVAATPPSQASVLRELAGKSSGAMTTRRRKLNK